MPILRTSLRSSTSPFVARDIESRWREGCTGMTGDSAALHLRRAGVSAGSRLSLTAFPRSRYDLLVAVYDLSRLIEILYIQHGGTNEQ